MKQRFLNLWQVFTDRMARFFHRKRLIRYAVYLSLLIVLYIFREPILRGFGNYLITEDEIEQADAVYILGGSSNDRAAKAIQIYKDGFSERFYCTGGHISKEFELLDTTLTEAEITQSFLVKKGIPKRNAIAINDCFSTRDEADLIYDHANKNKFKKIIILSSKFHLRRVKNVFEEKFEGSEISTLYIGAPSTDYNEDEWWRYEKGLIMVNNEYLKLVYYWWTE